MTARYFSHYLTISLSQFLSLSLVRFLSLTFPLSPKQNITLWACWIVVSYYEYYKRGFFYQGLSKIKKESKVKLFTSQTRWLDFGGPDI